MKRQRVFIYSHDTYGLGHIRRNLAIAERLTRLSDDVTVLIATGSPRTHAFGTPEGVDFLKLPSIIKRTEGGYRPRSLRLSLADTVQIRAEMILGAAHAFRPDLILVDHSVVGVERELVPLFDALSRYETRPLVVYGMRDIVDEIETVKAEWQRAGAWRYVDRLFDRVLVYGDRRVLSTAAELDLDARLGDRIKYTGYIARSPRALERTDPTKEVLVTCGGGGDGVSIIEAYVEYLEKIEGDPGFRSTIVTGPFLARSRRAAIRERLEAAGKPVTLVEFTDCMEELYAKADAVISMAGYNAVAEILASGLPALLIPREVPRLEQRLRAERIAPIAGFRVATD